MRLIAATALAAAAGIASADVLNISLDDLASWDIVGDTDNYVNQFDIGASSHVHAYEYTITIETVSPSYLSEVELWLTDSAFTDGVIFTPGFEDGEPGTMTYTVEYTDLVAEDLDFSVGADGLLRLEIAEGYDDFPDDIDANISGSFTVYYDVIPAPGAATAFAGAGLLAVRRRRR